MYDKINFTPLVLLEEYRTRIISSTILKHSPGDMLSKQFNLLRDNKCIFPKGLQWYTVFHWNGKSLWHFVSNMIFKMSKAIFGNITAVHELHVPPEHSPGRSDGWQSNWRWNAYYLWCLGLHWKERLSIPSNLINSLRLEENGCHLQTRIFSHGQASSHCLNDPVLYIQASSDIKELKQNSSMT